MQIMCTRKTIKSSLKSFHWAKDALIVNKYNHTEVKHLELK